MASRFQALIVAIARVRPANSFSLKCLRAIKLRASQINGCAYCIDMHWKDLKAVGESDQRPCELSVWEEAPFYTDRERAALAWTETVTSAAETHVPDEVYETVNQ